MKTVLLIESSGTRYFRRHRGAWQLIDKPDDKQALRVIADLPEETLEAINLPVLFGRDRSHFLERHLSAAFPHSQFRAAFSLSGKLFKPVAALLNGFSTEEHITQELAKLDNPVTGVWGVFMLLMLVARRLALKDIIIVFPGQQYLRILVIKQSIPVITRCIHRYGEEGAHDNDEIQRTRQHLESHQVFEYESIPPVLYLSDPASTDITGLLPLPDAFSPKGDAGYLHPLLEQLVSSTRGQLAPLKFRARHLTDRLRRAAYAGSAACLLAATLSGQSEIHALFMLNKQENTLKAALKKATDENQLLAHHIKAYDTDPAQIRQATKFAALDIDPAPTPELMLQFVASLIADLPEVRIRSLAYKFINPRESFCQGQSSRTDLTLNHTELQFSILLNKDITRVEENAIRRHISALIKTNSAIQLIHDPAVLSPLNAISGGYDTDRTDAENVWCMSIPWNVTPHKDAL